MQNVLTKILDEIKTNKKVAMVMVTKVEGVSPGVVGSLMGVYENGQIIGSVGGGKAESIVIEETLKCIASGESKNFAADSIEYDDKTRSVKCGSKTEVFIRVYNPRPKLLLVGGGHVASELYKLGHYMGFAVSIFEEREEFCTRDRFPDAQELILGDIAESLRNYNIDDNCYIVMVSKGHAEDETALKEVVLSNAKYIGMIGSKKKVKSIFDNIISQGISKESLDKVYSPIGIAIGGKDIKEIVLGIMAEIVLVKNGGTLEHLKNITKKV